MDRRIFGNRGLGKREEERVKCLMVCIFIKSMSRKVVSLQEKWSIFPN